MPMNYFVSKSFICLCLTFMWLSKLDITTIFIVKEPLHWQHYLYVFFFHIFVRICFLSCIHSTGYLSSLFLDSADMGQLYPGYDIKPSDTEVTFLDLWGMWSTPSLSLLPDPLLPKVVVPGRVPSVGQVELFNHLLYLKPFNFAQTND